MNNSSKNIIDILHRSILLIVILIFLFNSSTLFSRNSNLKFEYLTTDDGIPQSEITSILIDWQGFLWIGTSDGLNKYDGYSSIIYRHDPADSNSISGNMIEDIYEDSKKDLWISTNNGFSLFIREYNKFINFRLKDNNSNYRQDGHVYKIVQDSTDNYWIGSLAGLFQFNRKTCKFVHYYHDENNPESLNNDGINTLLKDSNGNLWVGTHDGGLDLFHYNTKKFTHFIFDKNDPTSIPSNNISEILEDNDGNIWIGAYGSGLCRLHVNEQGKYEFIRFKLKSNSENYNDRNNILSLTLDGNRGIWIGTQNGGLDYFDKQRKTFKNYSIDKNDPGSLNSNCINAIFLDNYGNMYVGTAKGGVNIFKQDKQIFQHYKSIPGNPNSLSFNVVTNFLEDDNHDIWIGTDGGGLNLFNVKTNLFQSFNSKNSNLTSNAIIKIYQDSKGQLWIGTWAGGFGVFDIKTKKFKMYTSENSQMPSNNVFDILEDEKNNLWLATFGSGLVKFNPQDNTFKSFIAENNNERLFKFTNLYKYKNGYLYIGGNIPSILVFDVKNETFSTYSSHENINFNISPAIVMLETNDSTVWLGAYEGLFKYDKRNKSIRTYTLKDGLPHIIILGILEDDHGNLWLSTRKGLSKFNPHEETFKNYTEDDGLQGIEFNFYSYYKTKSGHMLFGGLNGFNYFHPDSVKDNSHIPPVVITDFLIFNKSLTINNQDSPLKKHITSANEINLSYKHSVFSFEFAALDYTAPEKNEYAYMLKGFDKEWNYIGNKRTATYTNINPGEYAFHVKGSNNDGIWNEEGTSIKLIIIPPYWQTWWFRILIIIFIVAFILTVYKIRVRNIQIQRKELEIKVKERTQELKKAYEEITEKANALEVSKKETDNILHNVEEGFFLLNKDYEISSQYSSALESIFSTKKIARVNIVDFLENKIPDDEIENIKTYLLILFDDQVNEDAVKHLNPLIDIEFTFPKEKDNDSMIKKYLNFNFKRIIADDQRIVELIVTVRDVTRQILLSKQLKEEEVRRERLVQLMLSILDVEPEMLNDFSESAQRELEFVDKIMNHDKIDNYHELLRKVFRSMHLIKGNAKLLNIDYFAQNTHQFEDMISDIQKKSTISENDIDPLREKLRELQTGIEEMEKIIERMGKLLTHKGRKRKTDTRSLLRSVENMIKDFSSDLNKKIKLNYKNFKINIIPNKYHILVKEVLIQLVRNSISHGIETPGERMKVKKPQYGIIEISTFKKNGIIGFRLRDDGRGIQVEKLKEKALQSGQWKADEINRWNDQEAAQLIFTSGITTSGKVDMVAGRGVGMDGVKYRLQEYHGKININFSEGEYCEFEIILPIAA